MATLNLKQIGGLVKIESSDYPGEDIYLNVSGTKIKFVQPQDGTTSIQIVIGTETYDLGSITDIQVNGTPVTNQADFETQIATVFPEANGGSGGSATLQEVTDLGSTTDNDLEVTDTTKGLILTSPDNSRWRITITDAGVLVSTEIV